MVPTIGKIVLTRYDGYIVPAIIVYVHSNLYVDLQVFKVREDGSIFRGSVMFQEYIESTFEYNWTWPPQV